MPEQESKNPPAAAPSVAPAAVKPEKQFDVALVDPTNPAIEHWPRVRVTVDAASVADLTPEQKAPPKDATGKVIGESAEAETKRFAFLVGEIERGRAVAAYNAGFGLTDSHCRYDVVVVVDGGLAPAPLSEEWTEHLKHIHGAKR